MSTKVKLKQHSNLNATVAKIHAVYGKRLKAEDYSALMSSTSVSDVAGYLKRNTHYSKALEEIDLASVHRGVLEDVLRKSYIEEYYRLIGFEKIGSSEFYNFVIVKTIIDEILICIQHIIAGSEDHITTIPIYLSRYTDFDLLELAKVRTFSELLSLVEKTPYYSLLKPLKPLENETIDYAMCELRLRSYYYERLLKALDKFDKHSRESLKKFVAMQIDLINISNSYRMTKYFHSEAEYIKPKMLPIYKAMSEKAFDDLYDATNIDDFVARLKKTKYGREMEALGCDINDVERAIQIYRYNKTKRAFSRSQTPAECFYTFNWLMDCELKNIIRIIEGIRYSLTARDISEMLIS